MRKITAATQSALARRYLAAKARGENVAPGSSKLTLGPVEPWLADTSAADALAECDREIDAEPAKRSAHTKPLIEIDPAVFLDDTDEVEPFPDEGAATLNEIFPADELEPIESEDEAHAAGVFDND